MNSALRYNNWGFLLVEVERNIICWLICGLHRSKYMGSARQLQASRLKSHHYMRSHQTQVSMFVTGGTWHTELLEPLSAPRFSGNHIGSCNFHASLLVLKGWLRWNCIPVFFFYYAEDNKTWSHGMTGKERTGIVLLGIFRNFLGWVQELEKEF